MLDSVHALLYKLTINPCTSLIRRACEAYRAPCQVHADPEQNDVCRVSLPVVVCPAYPGVYISDRCGAFRLMTRSDR